MKTKQKQKNKIQHEIMFLLNVEEKKGKIKSIVGTLIKTEQIFQQIKYFQLNLFNVRIEKFSISSKLRPFIFENR